MINLKSFGIVLILSDEKVNSLSVTHNTVAEMLTYAEMVPMKIQINVHKMIKN